MENNTQLTGVLDEIETLESSSQVYNVVESSALNESGAILGTGTDVAATYFNSNTGALDIMIGAGTDISVFAHELRHAYQFEIGEASFGGLMERAPVFLLDKHDELAGYQRQGLFGSNEGVTSIQTLPERYSELPTGPVSIHNVNSAIRSAVNLNNVTGLQRAANYYRQAFRANGRTFAPQ